MAKSRYVENELVDSAHYGTYPRQVRSMGLDHVDLLEGVQYFEHVLQRGERLDHLAHKFFREERHYWVIALVNDIENPLAVPTGTRLRIPRDVRDVFKKIFS